MPNVLILEDDLTLSDQWQTALEKEGYAVDCVDNVSAALTLCEQTEYKVIIVDMFLRDGAGNLKKEGGLTFLSLVYKKKLGKKLHFAKTIAVTGATQSEHFLYDPLESARSTAVDATLRKPFTDAILIQTVRDLIE
ncbi:response regulator [Hoeflea sp.]|uniref:response regulator n=1 Tax=Hoeflea sp. TaxID=1940281 RepID=UPI003748F66E